MGHGRLRPPPASSLSLIATAECWASAEAARPTLRDGDACERLESTDRHPHDACLGLRTSFPEEPTENRTAPKQAA